MTIEKGELWGAPGALPVGGATARTDLEARRIVEAARRSGDAPPPIGLLGGDLCRTLNGPGDEGRLHSERAMTFPIDLVRVVLDERSEHWFVAHLIARRTWLWGPALVAMNAQWLGEWDLGPRSHPNDGLVDLTEGTLPVGDRLKARSRARSGSHLPHPALHTSRVRSLEVTLPTALDVRLDGERVGRHRHLAIEVEPDALQIVI